MLRMQGIVNVLHCGVVYDPYALKFSQELKTVTQGF